MGVETFMYVGLATIRRQVIVNKNWPSFFSFIQKIGQTWVFWLHDIDHVLFYVSFVSVWNWSRIFLREHFGWTTLITIVLREHCLYKIDHVLFDVSFLTAWHWSRIVLRELCLYGIDHEYFYVSISAERHWSLLFYVSIICIKLITYFLTWVFWLHDIDHVLFYVSFVSDKNDSTKIGHQT